MKLTITPFHGAGLVRVFARILESRKLGTPRRQKTWDIKTVAPEFTAENDREIFEREAKRWEQKQLDEFKTHESKIETKPSSPSEPR